MRESVRAAKGIRLSVALSGAISFAVVSLFLNLLMAPDDQVSPKLLLVGALLFFLASWVISGRWIAKESDIESSEH
ncbi:MAG: hypothetical protein ACE5OZ_22385 [Candidatus Heimdallarchaeota archaeon]